MDRIRTVRLLCGFTLGKMGTDRSLGVMTPTRSEAWPNLQRKTELLHGGNPNLERSSLPCGTLALAFTTNVGIFLKHNKG